MNKKPTLAEKLAATTTWFHATSLTNLNAILETGLINAMPHSPDWFTLDTSMMEHSKTEKSCKHDPKATWIIEFKLPQLPVEDVENGVYWTGYPQFFPMHVDEAKERAMISNREAVSPEHIVKLHRHDRQSGEITTCTVGELNKVLEIRNLSASL
ncbi:TPA: hypothetical protein I7730_16195 [Vibrio vulnificus]|uniref:Uncharacterized protein n=1 Tax=Vibrio vulnificus TaxID=672 RepID=A0A8H9N1Y8_VIBVL|nr:hypothetical protein [Vibrio vulnificus]